MSRSTLSFGARCLIASPVHAVQRSSLSCGRHGDRGSQEDDAAEATVSSNAELGSDGGEEREQRRRLGELLLRRALATNAATTEREPAAPTIAGSEKGMRASPRTATSRCLIVRP